MKCFNRKPKGTIRLFDPPTQSDVMNVVQAWLRGSADVAVVAGDTIVLDAIGANELDESIGFLRGADMYAALKAIRRLEDNARPSQRRSQALKVLDELGVRSVR